MAREKKPRGITFGGLRRRKSDSNGVWGHLANEDSILMSSNTAWRLPGWLLPSIAIASFAALVTLCFLVYGLMDREPNAQQVVAKARNSTFEVNCGDSTGTGVAIEVPTPDGYRTAVFTAAHVVDDCDEGSKVDVVYKGRTYVGKLYRKDPYTGVSNENVASVNDVAVIYLKPEFPTLEAAPSAKQGDWTIVLGNPWDELNYATFGIITSVEHDQYGTDAAINAGNSGGPLLDSKGRVLGLVSWKSMHSENDIDSRNKSEVLDADPGMAYAKRLRLTCEHIYSDVTACPFKN
ncbi:MAG: trypsin-like peptidase domain-containing protein [Rhodoluna sp.]|nr:trypsin-like peptidase domain-containing protein [Rhodoluna sp.]